MDRPMDRPMDRAVDRAMDGASNGVHHGQLVGGWWSPASTDVMSQLCRVCGEPAAGFHFGAFTCEGCKSFFGRTYNNLGSITECKNQGSCVINKKNRTSCKACRLRKCLLVGMSKSGSRYGRRSNWFKIHCLLQEQQHQHQQHQHQQEQQRQQHAPPPASPPEKSPKRSPSLPRGAAAATDALFAGTPLPAMLWGGPRGLLPPPHGQGHGQGLSHPLHLPFAPFLPSAAAAAAFNGGVASPLFPMPAAHPPRPAEWPRHSARLSLARPGSTSPPPSPRNRAVHKAVAAPLGLGPPGMPSPLRSPPPPLRSPSSREAASPRLDVDDILEQEQPMDLSRTAAASGRQEEDEGSGQDEGSDSGVSERESDRGKDGDVEGVGDGSPGPSPAAITAPAPVDLTARQS